MSTQKNQHYVPKFYQRFFSVDGSTIGVFLPEQRKKIDAAPIKYQASEDYLYTKDTKNPDNAEAALGSLEGPAKLVIEKLLHNPPETLTKEEEYMLYVFVLLQLGRTLVPMEMLQQAADMMAQQVLKEDKKIHDKNGDKKYDEITDEIIDNIKLNIANLGALSVYTHLQLIPSCIDLMNEFKVLVNRTKVGFVTSDNPACLYNMFLEKVEHINMGMGCRGVMFYLPLNVDRAVLYYDSKVYKCGNRRQKVVQVISEQDVMELNKLTAVNSRMLFFFNPVRTNVFELERMAAQKARFVVKEKIKEISGVDVTSGNPIVGMHHMGISCKLKLSFLKYLPTYNAKTAKTFDPRTDLYREIAYYKDDLEKKFTEDIKSMKTKKNDGNELGIASKEYLS